MKDDKLYVVALDPAGNPVGRDRIFMTVPQFEDLEFDAATSGYDIMPDGERFIFNLGPSASAANSLQRGAELVEELKNRATR